MAYVYVSYGGVSDALSDSTNCCLGPTSYIPPPCHGEGPRETERMRIDFIPRDARGA
jgi:hypothetical protein